MYGTINIQMNKNYVTIHMKYDIRELLRYDCKQIFLKYHPEFKNVFLTDGFIAEKIIKKYIEDDL